MEKVNMKVYILKFDVSNFVSVFADDYNGMESWYEPVPHSDEDYDPNVVRGDFIGLAGNIGLDSNAIEKAALLFEPWGELLPVSINHQPNQAFFFHCTTVRDAIDEKNSTYFESTLIDRFAFLPDQIGDAKIFTLPSNAPFHRQIFCVEHVKLEIERLRLAGLRFILQWSNEPLAMAYLEEQKLLHTQGPSTAVN
jgi:hypothetical protein